MEPVSQNSSKNAMPSSSTEFYNSKMYTEMKRRRFKILFVFAIIFMSIYIFFKSDLSPDLYFIHIFPLDNISCYTEFSKENLLPTVDEHFSPMNDSIFFHETSCKGGLNSRQACAVEAAARAHPHKQIFVLFLSPIKDINQKSLVALENLHNVNFYRVNLEKYGKDTPLEPMIVNGYLHKTKWKIWHTSDFLRYLSLYKWGGIYLDLDTVVVKSLDPLGKNWAGIQCKNSVGAGAMSFANDTIGRMVAGEAIRILAERWRGDDWARNGPGVITKVLQNMCHTKLANTLNTEVCEGFIIYNSTVFYPISFDEAKKYFKPQSQHFPGTYVHHVWNKRTKRYHVPYNSLYAVLAKQYCPSVYNAYHINFGV